MYAFGGACFSGISGGCRVERGRAPDKGGSDELAIRAQLGRLSPLPLPGERVNPALRLHLLLGFSVSSSAPPRLRVKMGSARLSNSPYSIRQTRSRPFSYGHASSGSACPSQHSSDLEFAHFQSAAPHGWGMHQVRAVLG